jgi:lysophospholipid acyltransferase (LPLAT)-like uncharacterized protein
MEANHPTTRPQRRKSGVIVPHAPTLGQRMAGFGVFALLRAAAGSVRYRFDDRSGFFDRPGNGPAIYCVWHNRLAVCLTGYFAYARLRNPTSGMAAMVSASKDGGFLSVILQCFRVQPVRGSSSRRGPQALLELKSWAEKGYDLAITPDGPRGPRYVVQEGVIALAQVTGLPIIPAAYNLRHKLQLNSWDKFQVPWPFSRCDVIVERPLRVPDAVSESQREELRLQLEQTLRAINQD